MLHSNALFSLNASENITLTRGFPTKKTPPCLTTPPAFHLLPPAPTPVLAQLNSLTDTE